MRAIREIICDLQRTSELNKLPGPDGGYVYGEPLLGVADGHDPLFALYKKIIGEHHLTPGEILARKAEESGLPYTEGECSVICWVLPFARRGEKGGAEREIRSALEQGQACNTGEGFNNLVRQTLEDYFAARGVPAAAPGASAPRRRGEGLPDERAFCWSERHALYAAGLGTFSLNGGFITDKGMAVRCGSIVAGKAYPATKRLYTDHQGNCLFAAKGICGKCMERCPASAISASGLDKARCKQRRDSLAEEYAKKTGDLETRADFCGLCQTNTPCEFRNPMQKMRERQG